MQHKNTSRKSWCFKYIMSKPVSRVLYWIIIYLGQTFLNGSSHLSGLTGRQYVPLRCCSGWGLHRPASRHAAGELLPHLSTLTILEARSEKLTSNLQLAVYLCCTFLKVAFTGSYPAPLPCGARTFLRYSLSTLYLRLSGLLNMYSIFSRTYILIHSVLIVNRI